MDDDIGTLVGKAQELDDLELAVLLCLISNEHCIIEAELTDIEQAERELQSICKETFGLKSNVVHCDENMDVDNLASGLLVEDELASRPNGRQKDSIFTSEDANGPRNNQHEDDSANFRIADVVILRDLNAASQRVQIQALELMRGNRTYTRNTMYTPPKGFLLIALNNADDGPRMNVHLNDHFQLSHFYIPEESPSQDKLYQQLNGSTSSVLRSSPHSPNYTRSTSYRSFVKPVLSRKDVATLADLSAKVKLHSDVRGYMHNIIVFMRMHRAVASGATPHATRHLYSLTQSLAPLHGIDFITPSLVALAVRKIYPHRLSIVAPEDEMSLQWGSELEAVREYLDGIQVEDIIDDVLQSVETPL